MDAVAVFRLLALPNRRLPDFGKFWKSRKILEDFGKFWKSRKSKNQDISRMKPTDRGHRVSKSCPHQSRRPAHSGCGWTPGHGRTKGTTFGFEGGDSTYCGACLGNTCLAPKLFAVTGVKQNQFWLELLKIGGIVESTTHGRPFRGVLRPRDLFFQKLRRFLRLEITC